MIVIIAGSREITDPSVLMTAIRKCGFSIDEVVSGGARGVDSMGEKWANDCGVAKTRFEAEWDKHGKRAGILRNERMGDYAEALLAIWDGKSRGTKHMIDYMTKQGKPVYVHPYSKP